MERELTFTIHAKGESTSLSLLLRTMEDIWAVIGEVEYAVTRQTPRPEWIVTELHSSAPTISIAPKLELYNIVDKFVSGLHAIVASERPTPPPHFTEPALKKLRGMRRLFRGRDAARSITVSIDSRPVVAIDHRISDHVDRIFTAAYSALGSLEGKLDAINLHGKPYFTIWESLSGSPIRCRFPSEPAWIERVKLLLKEDVTVKGTIKFFSNGRPAHLHQMVDFTPSMKSNADGTDLFGSIPDLTGGKDSVEYLRELRA